MHCWEDDYINSKYKLLFVGQENHGWYGDAVLELDECLNKYKDFALCNNGSYTRFWQYIYEINNLLMPEMVGSNKKNFLWTNISKFCTLEGKSVPKEVFKLLENNSFLLKSEIEITKPEVVIFFTGPNWDNELKHQFNKELNFFH